MRSFAATLALLCVAAPALADDRSGVQIETRAVEGSKVKEVEGTGNIDAPIEQVIAMLTDVESYPNQMPPTSIARLLARDGNQAWYYMVITPPVVSPRDYCIRMTVSQLPGGAWQSEWADTQEHCPAPQSGLLRIKRNVGSWTLTPTGHGTTIARYRAHTDPGGAVPAWIVNRVISHEVPGIFASVRKGASLARYALAAKR